MHKFANLRMAVKQFVHRYLFLGRTEIVWVRELQIVNDDPATVFRIWRALGFPMTEHLLHLFFFFYPYYLPCLLQLLLLFSCMHRIRGLLFAAVLRSIPFYCWPQTTPTTTTATSSRTRRRRCGSCSNKGRPSVVCVAVVVAKTTNGYTIS